MGFVLLRSGLYFSGGHELKRGDLFCWSYYGPEDSGGLLVWQGAKAIK